MTSLREDFISQSTFHGCTIRLLHKHSTVLSHVVCCFLAPCRCKQGFSRINCMSDLGEQWTFQHARGEHAYSKERLRKAKLRYDENHENEKIKGYGSKRKLKSTLRS